MDIVVHTTASGKRVVGHTCGKHGDELGACTDEACWANACIVFVHESRIEPSPGNNGLFVNTEAIDCAFADPDVKELVLVRATSTSLRIEPQVREHVPLAGDNSIQAAKRRKLARANQHKEQRDNKRSCGTEARHNQFSLDGCIIRPPTGKPWRDAMYYANAHVHMEYMDASMRHVYAMCGVCPAGPWARVRDMPACVLSRAHWLAYTRLNKHKRPEKTEIAIAYDDCASAPHMRHLLMPLKGQPIELPPKKMAFYRKTTQAYQTIAGNLQVKRPVAHMPIAHRSGTRDVIKHVPMPTGLVADAEHGEVDVHTWYNDMVQMHGLRAVRHIETHRHTLPAAYVMADGDSLATYHKTDATHRGAPVYTAHTEGGPRHIVKTNKGWSCKTHPHTGDTTLAAVKTNGTPDTGTWRCIKKSHQTDDDIIVSEYGSCSAHGGRDPLPTFDEVAQQHTGRFLSAIVCTKGKLHTWSTAQGACAGSVQVCFDTPATSPGIRHSGTETQTQKAFRQAMEFLVRTTGATHHPARTVQRTMTRLNESLFPAHGTDWKNAIKQYFHNNCTRKDADAATKLEYKCKHVYRLARKRGPKAAVFANTVTQVHPFVDKLFLDMGWIEGAKSTGMEGIYAAAMERVPLLEENAHVRGCAWKLQIRNYIHRCRKVTGKIVSDGSTYCLARDHN